MKHNLRILCILFAFTASSVCAALADKHEHHAEHGHDEAYEDSHFELTAAAIQENGISFEATGPRTLEERLRLNGRLSPNENKIAHVVPRFPGVVKETRKQVGDAVRQGETLAVVESNQNLQVFELKSPFSGLVLKRHATVGELVTESEAAFVVGDLSELWADLFLFAPDFSKVEAGQVVHLHLPDRTVPIEAKVALVSSVVDEHTQSKFVRAVIPNADGKLFPGIFLKGDVFIATTEVPLAVRSSAVQTIEGKPTVFLDHEGKFEPRQVSLGKSDGNYYEVRSGLKVGERYAFGNTFILKAEAGKGSAEHNH